MTPPGCWGVRVASGCGVRVASGCWAFAMFRMLGFGRGPPGYAVPCLGPLCPAFGARALPKTGKLPNRGYFRGYLALPGNSPVLGQGE
ncbi:hypothetical protein [Microbacterium sp. YY-01]|uniref:hypothetical protein n=1 Tax=Microbacterium sp. YY-01 TaxID=3421634 RepID=UPI003D18654B